MKLAQHGEAASVEVFRALELHVGVGVSGLNPKGLLIFLALLPQFTDPHARWPIAGQIGLLGLAFMVTCAVFYFVLGSIARTVLTARTAIARTVSRLSGAAMVLIGVALLVDRCHQLM